MNGFTVNHPQPWTTLVELARWRASHQPDQLAYRFLTDGDAGADLTYAALDRQARSIASFLQQAAYPQDATLHQLIEAQVIRTPDALALVCDDTSLTYVTLNERANQLAHALRELGVGPDVPVALFLERSVELIVGILATLKAGGAYVPLDPAYPAARVETMLGLCRAPVILTHPALAPQLPAHQATVIRLDADWPTLAQTLSHWSGDRSLLLELQQDGRDALADTLDLSRTVGWFATSFPLRLTVDSPDDLSDALQAIAEQRATNVEAYTPSDFPLSGLNQEDLSRFLNTVRRRS